MAPFVRYPSNNTGSLSETVDPAFAAVQRAKYRDPVDVSSIEHEHISVSAKIVPSRMNPDRGRSDPRIRVDLPFLAACK